jgi:hypothetical protein
MPIDDDKRLSEVLLVGAALAVVLVAALAAWTAWLGGGAAWPLVLAPFAVVLAVPLTVLAWLLAAEDGGDWSQLPSGTDDRVIPHVGRAAA